MSRLVRSRKYVVNPPQVLGDGQGRFLSANAVFLGADSDTNNALNVGGQRSSSDTTITVSASTQNGIHNIRLNNNSTFRSSYTKSQGASSSVTSNGSFALPLGTIPWLICVRAHVINNVSRITSAERVQANCSAIVSLAIAVRHVRTGAGAFDTLSRTARETTILKYTNASNVTKYGGFGAAKHAAWVALQGHMSVAAIVTPISGAATFCWPELTWRTQGNAGSIKINSATLIGTQQ